MLPLIADRCSSNGWAARHANACGSGSAAGAIALTFNHEPDMRLFAFDRPSSAVIMSETEWLSSRLFFERVAVIQRIGLRLRTSLILVRQKANAFRQK